VAQAAYASTVGNAVSNFLGFSYLTGMGVRFRTYAAIGLDIAEISAILGTAWISFWGAVLLVGGGVLVIHPLGLSRILPLGDALEVGIGAALLGVLCVAFAWTGTGARSVTLLGHRIALPDAASLALLLGAGLVDMLGAALALWVLLPADLAAGLPAFLVLYGAATALGVLSHAPGGIGVFEATMIAGLGAAGRSDVLVSLLIYRLIYYALPFAVAAASLAILWLRDRRGAVRGVLGTGRAILTPLIPPAAAGSAFLAGIVLMLSGSVPADSGRIALLRDLLPLSAVELSHLLASIAGLLLIVLARGLYLRLWRAWLLALGVLGLAAIASLAKGLDGTESVVLVAIMGLLASFRGAFYRVEGGPLLRLTPGTLSTLLILFAAALWIGFVVHRNTAYSADLWWRFAWSGDASRFLRASLAMAVVLAAIAANSLISARARRAAPEPIPDVVRRLVSESTDTEAPLALLGDKNFLVSEDGAAFVQYADTGRTLVTKGDPVGDPAAGRALIRAFRAKADREGRRCAFYAVSTRYLPSYLDQGLTIVKIGEIGIVNLAAFDLAGSHRKELRNSRSRAGRDDVVFEIIPAVDVPAILPELARVSDDWLTLKSGEEKGFALGAFEPAYLSNFDHAVLRRGARGPVIAFANILKGANRSQLSVDLMRHVADAPRYTMDVLFIELLLWGKAEGYATFSLGAAPFAGMEAHRLAPLWSRAGALIYEHGERFYHFEGLRAWKEKFDPDWAPNYLACPGGIAAPAVLYEVNVLISSGVRGLLS